MALVSVGADLINKRATRWLSNATARLATYRSYRDDYSRDAMRRRGIDTSSDPVYPDLVFGVPTPPYDPGDPQLVGVGVMAYYGGNDDRKQAAQIHSHYVETMTRFTRWLVDNGYGVRLFGGTASSTARSPSRSRRTCGSTGRTSSRRGSPSGLPRRTQNHQGDGTRRHGGGNALPQRDVRAQALQADHLLGYSRKFVSLMSDMGLSEFNQFADAVDIDRLVEQFKELESRQSQLQQKMADRNAANVRVSGAVQHAFRGAVLACGGTTPLHPPRKGGLRPPISPPREDAARRGAPRAVVWLRPCGCRWKAIHKPDRLPPARWLRLRPCWAGGCQLLISEDGTSRDAATVRSSRYGETSVKPTSVNDATKQ